MCEVGDIEEGEGEKGMEFGLSECLERWIEILDEEYERMLERECRWSWIDLLIVQKAWRAQALCQVPVHLQVDRQANGFAHQI